MGSAGTGMFGTYKDNGADIMPNDNSGNHVCPLEIKYIRLEDVAISDYFVNHTSVPQAGEQIEVLPTPHKKRMVVALQNTQEIIGNLPVIYNYLMLCISNGMAYSGNVVSSGLSPIPYIVVDLHA